ncbi:hypothetical protein Acr_03g0011250 [Actinidia rufa]|uniref:Vta1 C-terminal domain-containing protein n=1 Tax=Actinidia rufa TaxID=165716 RepID=A0A7J0ED04_9ERIC|nr:hypothetical protein Acr_03g0011250 [Actinidia rufa]
MYQKTLLFLNHITINPTRKNRHSIFHKPTPLMMFPLTRIQISNLYPSFTEASLPTVPSNYPSYYQGTDATHSTPPAPTTTNYPPPAQYNSSSRNGTVSEPAPTPTKTYQYDSNYEPSPEKIAEAHKAARFAVGALAFDDVSIAVDFLKKALELLTNPSAGQ